MFLTLQQDMKRLLKVIKNNWKKRLLLVVQVVVSSLLQAHQLVLTDQQMREVLQEVTRVQALANLVASVREREAKEIQFTPGSLQVASKPFIQRCHDILSQILRTTEALLTNIWWPFTGSQQERWEELRQQLQQSMTGLGISEVEKRQVVTAMAADVGRWYRCPRGHVYAIGECGRAVVEGSCPECGER